GSSCPSSATSPSSRAPTSRAHNPGRRQPVLRRPRYSNGARAGQPAAPRAFWAAISPSWLCIPGLWSESFPGIPASRHRGISSNLLVSLPSVAQVLDALRVGQGPDLHRDIVALDFVEHVVVGQDGRVAFAIELTTPACP